MKTKRPRIIPFAILTTVTLLTWAILDVWRTFQKPVPLEVKEEILKEFEPGLDRETLGELEKGLFFSDEETRALAPQPEAPVGGSTE